MSDLIERDKAIALFEKELQATEEREECTVNREYAIGFEGVKRILTAAPSAQQNRLERAVTGKSPEEIYDFLYWLMFDYARAYTDSRAAVIAWLKGE